MLGGLLLVLFLGAADARTPMPDPPGDAERGAVLAGLAGCPACHTADDGAPYAGGHLLETRWGTFRGSNLTPDPVHGLGGWSYADFEKAMRHGRSPKGRPYYPAFPYTAFTGIDSRDLADLWAHLRAVEPVARPDGKHDLNGLYGWRFLLRFWKLTGFHPGPQDPPEGATEQVARGAYLGVALGHCGECHTPRKGLGALDQKHALGGSTGPESTAPNITPSGDGIGGWDADELVSFFEDGMLPDGDVAGGHMRRIVLEGTAKLSDADREALAAWVLGHEPVGEPYVEEDEYEDDW